MPRVVSFGKRWTAANHEAVAVPQTEFHLDRGYSLAVDVDADPRSIVMRPVAAEPAAGRRLARRKVPVGGPGDHPDLVAGKLRLDAVRSCESVSRLLQDNGLLAIAEHAAS